MSGLPVLFYKIVNMKMDMDRLKGLFWGLVACVIITLLCGCKATRYVPMETVRTEYRDSSYWDRKATFNMQSVIDSLIECLSVNKVDCFIIIQDTAGNVKYHGEWHRNDKSSNTYHNVEKQDSTDYYRNLYYNIQSQKADSVQVPYPVEKKRGWWEKTRINLFPILVAAIAVLVFIVIWLARKVKPMKN